MNVTIPTISFKNKEIFNFLILLELLGNLKRSDNNLIIRKIKSRESFTHIPDIMLDIN